MINLHWCPCNLIERKSLTHCFACEIIFPLSFVTGFGKTLPPYGICARFAQCAFLVAQVKICESPDFVIYISNNPSSNCCRLLRRLVVLYEGEISLHFDPPSRHSHRTRSPLLWVVIRILYLDTARFIDLLYVRLPF